MERDESNADPRQPGLLAAFDVAARLTTDSIRRLPGGRQALALAGELERSALTLLRERLVQLERIGDDGGRPAPAALPPSPADHAGVSAPVHAFAELLERSRQETPADARQDAVMWTLRQLVPDEARMVAELAAGTTYPVVHVDLGGLGVGTTRVVRNISSIGRGFALHSKELTAQHLAHLLELGLVELGDEEEQHALEYEILEADSTVRRALEAAAAKRRHRARVVRQSVALSEFGRSFWEAVTPSGSAPPLPRRKRDR